MHWQRGTPIRPRRKGEHMSLQSYSRTQVKSEDPRRIELMLLQRINGRMATADTQTWRERLEAAYENRRVWNAFRTDLVMQDASGAGLADRLKAGLINLSLWIDSYSMKLIDRDVPLKPLIDINNEIIAGLRASLEHAPTAAAVPAHVAAPSEPIGPISA
jgi:flagellar protein FlaF